MSATEAPHVKIKCRVCGWLSSPGNYVPDFAKGILVPVCSRCHQPLK